MGLAPVQTVQIDIPGALPDGRLFLGWAPVQAMARLKVPPGPPPAAPVKVNLRNGGAVGKLLFAATRTGNGAASLPLTLPASGAAVAFWVGGDIAAPSRDYGDAVVEARLAAGNALVGTRQLMVRVRKNAVQLNAAERNRFLAALGTLNGNGLGRFRDFRDMHVAAASPEEHGDSGFLPWHRAYILDLERELQAIDPTVTLPYWRFDQPAPTLFTRDFLGLSSSNGTVQFTPGHALEHWVTDGQPGIVRNPTFNVAKAPHRPKKEKATFDLSGRGRTYASFRSMEIDPHGQAHVSFTGSISSIPTAAKDPLFFMLHCNVDRLWAKWQWLYKRHDPALSQSYSQGARIGHRLDDTMWPWNGITAPPRPPTAPGGAFAGSVGTPLPGPAPKVQAMLDYQGKIGGTALGFDYDDVPFEL